MSPAGRRVQASTGANALVQWLTTVPTLQHILWGQNLVLIMIAFVLHVMFPYEGELMRTPTAAQ